ncbi:MAG: hypothetical protein KatS3mg088_362 [Patescibacteria group bacterium]|nr:MAG: hypothetical protein KatS3mg088_362 [Patescibacteria group bacterium]
MDENQVSINQSNTNNNQSSVEKPMLGKVTSSSSKNLIMITLAVFVVGMGIFTGWIISGGLKGKPKTSTSEGQVVKTSKEAGVSDEKTFKDTATGVLKQGGVNGEGTHHLEREGGPSQYVYLTSSVIDLDSFIDKKVQVWGETISAAKAGWFMDVGKVKVLE